MTAWFPFLVLLSWKQDLVGSIHVQDLLVPAQAVEGGAALLGCHFDMEGDELYSVKWYKDGREFYRYVPNNWVPINHFPTAGITVDVSRSSSTVVALTNLKNESAGMYRCEVSGEAPKFATVFDEKYIAIHYLPKTSPVIQGLRRQYDFSERAVLNCSSSASWPKAQLKWFINDKPVPKEHLRGPWIRMSQERIGTTESILELRFTVMPKHFKRGVLSIKCQAIIAPLYEEEVLHQIVWNDDVYSTIATPVEFTDPSFQSLENNDFGFPPFDEDTSNETEDGVSNYQAKLAHAQYLLFIMLFIRLVL